MIKIDLKITIDGEEIPRAAIDELLTMPSLLRHIRHKLGVSIEKEEIIMATLDEVLQATTDESTLDDSIIALLVGIKGQLADALSGVTLPPAVQAKVDSVFTQLQANKTKVADAITANTTTP